MRPRDEPPTLRARGATQDEIRDVRVEYVIASFPKFLEVAAGRQDPASAGFTRWRLFAGLSLALCASLSSVSSPSHDGCRTTREPSSELPAAGA